jgi:hypothetical protein
MQQCVCAAMRMYSGGRGGDCTPIVARYALIYPVVIVPGCCEALAIISTVLVRRAVPRAYPHSNRVS